MRCSKMSLFRCAWRATANTPPTKPTRGRRVLRWCGCRATRHRPQRSCPEGQQRLARALPRAQADPLCATSRVQSRRQLRSRCGGAEAPATHVGRHHRYVKHDIRGAGPVDKLPFSAWQSVTRNAAKLPPAAQPVRRRLRGLGEFPMARGDPDDELVKARQRTAHPLNLADRVHGRQRRRHRAAEDLEISESTRVTASMCLRQGRASRLSREVTDISSILARAAK